MLVEGRTCAPSPQVRAGARWGFHWDGSLRLTLPISTPHRTVASVAGSPIGPSIIARRQNACATGKTPKPTGNLSRLGVAYRRLRSREPRPCLPPSSADVQWPTSHERALNGACSGRSPQQGLEEPRTRQAVRSHGPRKDASRERARIRRRAPSLRHCARSSRPRPPASRAKRSAVRSGP